MFLFTKFRRRYLRKRPIPYEWLDIIERNVPLYNRLPVADKEELQEHIQIFLAEKHFEGCGGLKITDEIKVTIAAQACILLLHRQTDYYPGLYSIVVYPNPYVARHYERDPSGIVTEGLITRIGESRHWGAVVLSWDDVLAGASDVHDGHNVVFHEFAHQLDSEDGKTDGSLVLPRRSMYIAWARILGGEFEKLRGDAVHGRETVLDDYGATSPAEFFAVATECFFIKPVQMKSKHPDLYEELKLYYRQDPADQPNLSTH